MQKTNKEHGPALVGVELQHKSDYELLLLKMNGSNIGFSEINKNDQLFGYLI
jgi:threonine dehydratase